MVEFNQELHPGVKAHSSAHVDEPCEIGEGTRIWHFSHLMPDCQLGAGCNIGQNVFIASGVKLGNNVKVQNNVSIYSGVILEDDVFCGPSMVFTNILTPRSEIVRKGEYSTTLVRRGASLGANSTILCGTRIGKYALVAAGAVVSRDVPAYALVAGVPARRRSWVCRCGLTLKAVSDDRWSCSDCGNLYQEADGKLSPLEETQS